MIYFYVPFIQFNSKMMFHFLLYPFWVGHSNSFFGRSVVRCEFSSSYGPIICCNLRSTGSLICFYNLYTNLIHRNEALWWCNIEPKFTFWNFEHFLWIILKVQAIISIVFKLKPYFIVALLLWYTTKWSLPHHVWPPGGDI